MSTNMKPQAVTAQAKAKKQSQFKEIWRRYKKSRTAMVGLIIFLAIILMAICADLIVPYSQAIAQNKNARFLTPTSEHWFGCDHIGRDVFARVVHGSRVSVSVGIVVSAVCLLGAGFLGAVTGYYGGMLDNIVMRVLDVFMCIPSNLMAMAVVAALGTNLVNLYAAMSISQIPPRTRLIRSVILTEVGQDYIEAARSYGAKDSRIIIKYVIPNAMGPIIVNTTSGMATLILVAAGLSFLGMGVQPPTPEWGSMLSDAREYIRNAPHLLYFPGIAIGVTALSINLLGDGLRDALDPKLKD